MNKLMSIFLYEHVMGGGLLAGGEPADSPLLAEGQAMLLALAEDLAKLPAIKVYTLRDHRLPTLCTRAECWVVRDAISHTAAFDCLAAGCDGTLLIAPETGGKLHDLAKRVEAVGGRLLGPAPRLIALAADKQAACDHLARHGVPVPYGQAFQAGQSWPEGFPLPAVLKPRDGAGSCGVRLLRQPLASEAEHLVCGRWRLERFCPGLAASAAVIAGPAGHVLLPPCTQQLTQDGKFRYLGGSLMQDANLAARAHSLVRRAMRTLPEARGYIGFDLVLGEQPSDDVVIEVNPRPTTSYVGLRCAVRENLAGVLIATMRGEPAAVTNLGRPLAFTAAGIVQYGPQNRFIASHGMRTPRLGVQCTHEGNNENWRAK